MIIYIGTYLAIMTSAGFSVCAYDKRAAKRKLQRVSERSLFAVAFLGGSLGVFAAMIITNHKIRKGKFVTCISLIMMLQAAAIVYAVKAL